MESQNKIAIPTTIEGIAVHLEYMSKSIAEINQKMDLVQNNTVNRSEWTDHLKRDEDHEARIRVIEQDLWKFIGASSIISAGIAFLGALIAHHFGL